MRPFTIQLTIHFLELLHQNLPEIPVLKPSPKAWWIVSRDSKVAPKANLEKYIKIDGKWRFVPVLKQNGVPYPDALQDHEHLPSYRSRSCLDERFVRRLSNE